jgi:hypothetical protein
MTTEPKRKCGDCVKFRTPKCTFAFSTEPIAPPAPKIVKTWNEYIQWLYDFSPGKPVPMKQVSNYDIIWPNDATCADFVLEVK